MESCRRLQLWTNSGSQKIFMDALFFWINNRLHRTLQVFLNSLQKFNDFNDKAFGFIKHGLLEQGFVLPRLR